MDRIRSGSASQQEHSEQIERYLRDVQAQVESNVAAAEELSSTITSIGDELDGLQEHIGQFRTPVTTP